MSSAPTTSPHLTRLQVEEDGGLGALIGSAPQALARDAALGAGAVLQAAKDVLRASFNDGERRRHLDPFADAQARNVEVIAVLRGAIAQQRERGGVLARVPTDGETLLALFAATVGWGPAQRYLDDARVNEVKIIGRRIRVQESGKPFVTVPEQFASIEEVRDRAMLLASVLGVRLDAEVPQATLPLAHGTRMHVTIAPRVQPDSILICIRRGRRECWDLSDLLRRGTLDGALLALLDLLARARCSFLIAGRTGSGKTGLLEALANSWPGEPHIVTIEDHTAEIGIRRHDLWTREHVNTEHDPLAFGRVAKEALRQTPDLLLPGETRGNEAGAILALVLSDHPVMTTLHARSCREALERFASFASMPGAYMYEGRRADALRDTCVGFAVVIKVDIWEDLGLRLITEVALTDGSAPVHGALQARLIPLARAGVGADGRIAWELAAHADAGGLLRWAGGVDATPPALAEKLARARALSHIRAAAPTLDVVASAIARATRHILASEADRALATVRGAWSERRDGQLIPIAQQALALAPDGFAAERAQAAALRADLEHAIHERRWMAARERLDALSADLALVAACEPEGGWGVYEAAVQGGLALHRSADVACREAEVALGQGQPRVALELLARISASELPPDLALALALARERAMEQLLALGQGSAEALGTVRAQRAALERALAPVPGTAARRGSR